MNFLKELRVILIALLFAGVVVLITGFFMMRTNAYNERISSIEHEFESAELAERKKLELIEMESANNSKGLNIYEKLVDKVKVNILVIANEDVDRFGNFVEKLSIVEELDAVLENSYGGEVEITHLKLNGSNMAWGYIMLKQLTDVSEIDMVVIDGGKAVNNSEYDDLFYFGIVQTCVNENPKVVIAELDEMIEYIDSDNEFVAGNLGIDIIEEMKIDNADDECMGGVESIDADWCKKDVDVQLVSNANSGFVKVNKVLMSNSARSYIQYEWDKGYLILTYANHPSGGLFHVFVNSEEVGRYDTKSELVYTNSAVIKIEDESEVVFITENSIDETVVIIDIAGISP